MAATLFFSVILLSLISFSISLPSQTILNAAQILSDSGFISMSLTLQLVSDSLISALNSATIFSPSDSAFSQSGQPSLSLLQFHSSPLTFTPRSLTSLAPGTKIPTMFTGNSVLVTTSDPNQQISLNNISVDISPIFDDGSLIIFGIDGFFDPNFVFPAPIQSFRPDLGCRTARFASFSFDAASREMRDRGYSTMASFLDLQLLGFRNSTRWTIFAPNDQTMMNRTNRLSNFPSFFHRYVIPCKHRWSDLLAMAENSTTLTTSLQGFTINVTKSQSGDTAMLNEAAVTSPDIYSNDWIVVHGLSGVLS